MRFGAQPTARIVDLKWRKSRKNCDATRARFPGFPVSAGA
jgi:hypothetical protein